MLRAFLTPEENRGQDTCSLSFNFNLTNGRTSEVVNPRSFAPLHYEAGMRGSDFPFGTTILKE